MVQDAAALSEVAGGTRNSGLTSKLVREWANAGIVTATSGRAMSNICAPNDSAQCLDWMATILVVP